MEIIVDDLSGQEIEKFLAEHISDMQAVSPPESKHALDLDGLRKPEITFWSVYESGKLVGCGALKQLSNSEAEIKSMRTSANCRGKGIASSLLQYILLVAEKRGYNKVSLETGSMPFFAPARNLYAKFGFVVCPPFGEYKTDPNSVFMAKVLKNA
jgi:putative acetyltransferase